MPIYKYTLKKYAKSYSTWIIALITLVLIIFGVGVLPFEVYPPRKSSEYIKRVFILIPTITVFLSIFSSIFSGFKSANMFKDEIEDGTFLIMISKPISRRRILVFKWLALQTFLVFYAFFTAFSEAITIIIFDNGDQFTDDVNFLGISSLKEKAFVIFGFTGIILYIMSLTFSSIAILLSTRLSVSSTVGFAVALGVVIPITRLIPVFTKKEEVTQMIPRSLFENINIFENIDSEKIRQYTSLIKEIKNEDGFAQRVPPSILNLAEALDLKKTERRYKQSIAALQNDPQSIYEIGYLTGEKNAYRNLWFLDTNFQISNLSSFVYDQIIPPSLRNSDSVNSLDPNTYNHPTTKNVLQSEDATNVLQKLNSLINHSWSKTVAIRADLLSIWVALFYLIKSDLQASFKKHSNSLYYFAFEQAYARFMKSIATGDHHAKIVPADVSASKKTFQAWDSGASNRFFLEVVKVINILREESTKPQTSMDDVSKVLALFRFVSVFQNSNILRNFIEIEDKKLASLFFWLTPLVDEIINPIDVLPHFTIRSIARKRGIDTTWINTNKIAKEMGLNIYLPNKKSNPTVRFRNEAGELQQHSFTDLYSYALLGENLGYGIAYYRMFGLLKDKAKFARFEQKEYASKYLILAIFVTVSITLIPLSYWSIRKRDFK